MMELLNRINELATKNKEIGLTASELLERDQLRTDYLQQIRGQMLDHISSLTFVDENGQDVTPEKVKEYKNNLYDF